MSHLISGIFSLILIATLASSVPARSSDDTTSIDQKPLATDIFSSGANADKTPYELLESLYEAGTPTQLSEIPSFDDCGKGDKLIPLKGLKAPVTLSTKKADLGVSDNVYINITQIKIAAGEVQAAVNGGPLFPISPAVPEIDTIIPNFFGQLTGYNGHCPSRDDIPGSLKGTLLTSHYSLHDTSQGATEAEDDGSGVFHTVDGVFVEKITAIAKDAQGSTVVKYYYFWPMK